MRQIFIFIVACGFAVLAGCEAVVGDFEVRSCEPDPPTSCADLGDADEQLVGCCNGDATVVYFCESGPLESRTCSGDLTCDYNPDIDAMGCVE